MFIVEWIVFYIAIMFAMSVDNIFWIPTSPEYNKLKTLPNVSNFGRYVTVEGKKYYNWLDYIIWYRIKSVLTHWRDIIPAIITSFILTILL